MGYASMFVGGWRVTKCHGLCDWIENLKFLVDSQDTINAILLSHSAMHVRQKIFSSYKVAWFLMKKNILSQNMSRQAIEIWIEILNHQKYQAWKHGLFRKKKSTTIFYFLDILIFVFFLSYNLHLTSKFCSVLLWSAHHKLTNALK